MIIISVPLVVAEQRRRREVMQFGKVSAAVPVNGQFSELVERPAILTVAFAELVYVKIRGYRVGVDIETFGEEVLALLRVVLGLQRIVKNFGWPDAHTIRGG